MLCGHVAIAAALLSLARPAPTPPRPPTTRRVKGNKYAEFSKVEEARKSLRFSNLDDADEAGDGAAGGAKPRAVEGVEPKYERALWKYPDAAAVDPSDPTTFGFTEVGRVTGAHGIGGAVRVVSDSDFAEERLCKAGVTVWMRRPRRLAPRELHLLSGRRGPGKGVYLLKLADVAR